MNYITTGVVWARAAEGNNFASVELMKIADNKAQTLFDICFEVIDGPSAPDINFVELDQKIIINLTNAENSNNFANQYVEEDPFISDVLVESEPGVFENLDINKNYVFEGYQVFQLKDATVTSNDLYNPDKAYMIYQCDVENYRTANGDIVTTPTDDSTPIANLVNYSLDESIGPNVYLPQNMTLGAANSGINNSILITEDKFATGDPGLINNKAYYYMAIAYAYNEYIPYATEIPFTSTSAYSPSVLGQKKPYLAGRKNIKTYTIIPHKIESFGDIPTASYGTIPSQTGLAGSGNGGSFLELTDDSRNKIATNYFADTLSYMINASPALISVVDPLSVPDADFIFRVHDVQAEVNDHFTASYFSQSPAVAPGYSLADSIVIDATWSLMKIQNGDTTIVSSNNTLQESAQQIIPEWGLAVKFQTIGDLESGQVDNLGCLTCSGWFSVTNSQLSEIIWDSMENGTSVDDLTDILTGTEYTNAQENLWLSPIEDIDDIWQFAPFIRPLDWVRSGNNSFTENDAVLFQYQDFGDIGLDGFALDSEGTALDPNGVYENGQALVPYKLVSYDWKGNTSETGAGITNTVNSIDTIGGGVGYHLNRDKSDLNNLNNVDVVLTPNKDLWTRCPVIDLSEKELTWTGNGPPTDNNQVSNNDWTSGDEYGSWDLGDGTGEYGENKWDIRMDLNVDKDGNPDGSGSGRNSENGWGWFPGYAVDISSGKRLNLMFSENSSLGALHNANDMIYNPTGYIYGAGEPNNLDQSNWDEVTTVSMNGGHSVFVFDTEYQGDNHEDNPHYNAVVGNGTNGWNPLRKGWVLPHIQWVGNWVANLDQEWLSDEIVIRARVQENYGFRDLSVIANSNSDSLVNDGYSYYKFNSSEILTLVDNKDAKEAGLKEVNIVPNPYNGASGYETGQVDNRVKITNLPRECTISIYTVNGNLIRQVKKDNDISFFEWDLKNNYGIPISSGVYIVHIDAGEIGEKVLKWFGALRPTDLDSF